MAKQAFMRYLGTYIWLLYIY